MTYRIQGLNPAPYRPLFGLSDGELTKRGIVRMTVDSPTFPCRVSLTDRDLGEKVLLLNHVSHDVAGPYRASHAIFVTEGADEPAEYVDEVPPVFATRGAVAARVRPPGHDGRGDPHPAGRSRRRDPKAVRQPRDRQHSRA